MFTFTVRRLLFAVPTLLAISFIIFALLDLSPGDPLSDLPLTIPPDVREQIRAGALVARRSRTHGTGKETARRFHPLCRDG